MLTQSVRFLSLVFTALILGAAFCHVLEMPVKLALPASDYLVVQQIYGAFGPVGSVLELGAIALTAALTVLVRARRSFAPTLLSAALLVVALLAWFAVVNPVNPHWAAASPSAVPAAFASLRARWEWGHALHAALLFAAFAALACSILLDASPRSAAVPARRAAAGRAA